MHVCCIGTGHAPEHRTVCGGSQQHQSGEDGSLQIGHFGDRFLTKARPIQCQDTLRVPQAGQLLEAVKGEDDLLRARPSRGYPAGYHIAGDDQKHRGGEKDKGQDKG